MRPAREPHKSLDFKHVINENLKLNLDNDSALDVICISALDIAENGLREKSTLVM